MNFRKIIAFIFALNLAAFNLLGQSNCVCPNIEIMGPAGVLKAGEPAVFTAQVGGDKGQSTYNWTVSGGVITKGQGTSVIEVDTSGLEGNTITATVQIGGWCAACENMTRSEVAVIEAKREAILIDKFTRSNCDEVLARMDAYMIELANNPSDSGYVIIYGKAKQTRFAEREIQNWIKIRKYDPSRLTTIRGGSDSERAEIEFWRVPPGANPPEVKSPVETEETETPKTNPKEPYIFSSEYYDGIAGCGSNDGEEIDLEGYAKMLKENPKSRGNIVILMTSKTEFRKKEKEILNYLAKKGIARKRLKTFYVNAFGGVELWFLP